MRKPPVRKDGAVETFEAYSSRFPQDVQKLLRRVRSTVKRAVPGVSETISYRMPAFKLSGRVVMYFAAFKTHIGLYPPVRGPASLKRQITAYAGPKGNLRLPYAKPMPLALIGRIARSHAARVATKTRET